MSATIAAARSILEGEGWSFVSNGHLISGHHLIAFRSPRMTMNAMARFPAGADAEQAFRQEEAAAVAYERHDATISVALDGVKADLLRNLSSLYRMQADGKVGVEIPTEVTVSDLVVPLSLPQRPANPEGEMP